MKVLVLTCNTGSGYNTAGWALYEEFHSSSVDCHYLDLLSFVAEPDRRRVLKQMSSLYADLTTRLPSSARLRDRIAASSRRPRARSRIHACHRFYQKTLRAYLAQEHFDVILAVHLFAACALAPLRKELTGHTKVYALITDFYVLDEWKLACPDILLIPHRDLIRPCMKLGFAYEQILALGIPLPRTYGIRRRILEARQTLQLPTDGKMVFITAESFTAHEMQALVTALRRSYGSRLIFVLLGDGLQSEKSPYARLSSHDARVFLREDRESFSLYLDASDLFITRPIGLYAVEAIAKRVPCVLVHPLAGMESLNALFLARHGAAAADTAKNQRLTLISHYIEDEEARLQMVDDQQVLLHPRNASSICQYILASEAPSSVEEIQ